MFFSKISKALDVLLLRPPSDIDVYAGFEFDAREAQIPQKDTMCKKMAKQLKRGCIGHPQIFKN